MTIVNEQTIWFPDDTLYQRRMGNGYSLKVEFVPLDRLVGLVQRRAEEDGKWILANGLVGEDNENEAKMLRMMAFVSHEKNIAQCREHILAEGKGAVRDVDWVCRELATASKFMIR